MHGGCVRAGEMRAASPWESFGRGNSGREGPFLVWAFGARDGLVESACVLYNGLRIYWPLYVCRRGLCVREKKLFATAV